jgi:predicted Zn finger-like uncharacterized protein
MAEEKFTRCPGCNTIFRVTPPQLALRAGQVRCGHCHTVFDGVASLVSLAPHARGERNEPAFDDPALGPPTVTLRNAHALQPAPAAAPRFDDRVEPAIIADDRQSTSIDNRKGARIDDREDASIDDRTDVPTDEHTDVVTDVPTDVPTDEREIDYASRFSAQEKGERRRVPTWIYGMLVPVLVLLFAGQALFHFRDAIAAHWPNTKPTLIKLCAAAGCQVRALQDVTAISIEASDLQADPAHKGLLVLSATVRNRAPYPLAYPFIELTLSDTQDQPVVRRAFAPSEYLSGAADPDVGIAGNSELPIRLFIDASATTQAGYQVYLFYP